jgi:diguanylate cyclase (GGDEF)-like protein
MKREAAARLRILLLEDDPEDADLLLRELRRGGVDAEATLVATREEFEAQLDSRPDAILSDFHLPAWDGLQALRMVRERGLETPFIIVSGLIGEDAAVEAMRHGADDYLLKDRLGRLGSALMQALDRKRLREEARSNEHRREQGEEGIRRLNRVYAVLSGINTAIVRIREHDELFREICRIAVSAGGFIVARALDVDAAGQIRIAATSEADPRLFQRIVDEYNRDPERSQSLLALGMREGGKPLVSNDVAADPRIPNRAALTKEGNYALALLPIVVEKRIAGMIILRSREAGMFDEDEMRLLLELVSNLSFALELMDKQKKLDYLAYYDVLTGLANRNLFQERLTQHLRAGKRGQVKLALALVNVERFKMINDSLGRQAGDELLEQLAARLARAADPQSVARIGGDHFAIVVPEVKGRSEIGRNVERIWRECFTQPFVLGGTELRVSAKAGIALYPSDGRDAETLFASAEAALQKAQETGERLQFHARAMTEQVAGQLALENKLRQALENDEFVLHYQPKVDLETRDIVGVEALIRWQSPELGLVPPMKFIPLMEATGMILQAGTWALKRASLDHRKWAEQGLAAPRVAVNVSPIQLRQRDFVASVQAAVADGIAPTAIDLEITESLIMEDVQGSIEKLKAVRALGMNIAIDDFGTGYSSLGYLAKLPVQSLKIDRSFIVTMLNDPDTMTLVSTIVSLAHSLRRKVVAEGVDEEEQAKMLRLLRCDELQGYLFSKPLPFEAMTALLRQGKKA